MIYFLYSFSFKTATTTKRNYVGMYVYVGMQENTYVCISTTVKYHNNNTLFLYLNREIEGIKLNSKFG